jgi:hypothetical protein
LLLRFSCGPTDLIEKAVSKAIITVAGIRRIRIRELNFLYIWFRILVNPK